MTAKATIKQSDMIRAARVAKANDVAITVKCGDLEITVFPNPEKKDAKPVEYTGDIRL